MKNWKQQFTEEFGIHFDESELQFAIEFIEDLLEKHRQEIIKKLNLEKEKGGNYDLWNKHFIDKIKKI